MFAANPTGMLAGIVFTSLLLLAAIGDVRTRRIPNRLVAVLALLGMAYSAGIPVSLSGTLKGLEGLGAGLLCWLPFYVLGWLGGGDVKLFSAAGAWLGPARAVEGSAIAALLGALVALMWMLRARGLRNVAETFGIAATLPKVLAEPGSPGGSANSLPYGVAIAAGAIYAAWMPLFLFG